MDSDGEAIPVGESGYHALCSGTHVEIKGGFHITPEQGSVDCERGTALQTHHDQLILSVGKLSAGASIRLMPGSELCHPLNVHPYHEAPSS